MEENVFAQLKSKDASIAVPSPTRGEAWGHASFNSQIRESFEGEDIHKLP
jgi:hypothetical protein